MDSKQIAAIIAVYKFLEEQEKQNAEYAKPEEVSMWKLGHRSMNMQANSIMRMR
jgi:hypothetical protein